MKPNPHPAGEPARATAPTGAAASPVWTAAAAFADDPPSSPAPPRPRRDGWTAERQLLFLEELALTGNVRASAEAAGMSPRSAFRLRAHPAGAAFARAWDAALATAAGGLLTLAFQRAVEGAGRQLVRDGRVVAEARTPSDRMLMFLLRHLSPELFGYAGPAPRRAAALAAEREAFAPAAAALADLDLAPDTAYPANLG